MAIERHLEGRDFETRNHDMITFGRPTSAHFDLFYNAIAHKAPPGMKYAWANVDSENLVIKRAQGYTLVPASRHPEYAMHQYGQEAPRFLYKRNQVLVEIPEEIFYRLRNEKIQRTNAQFQQKERENIHKKNQSIGNFGGFNNVNLVGNMSGYAF